MQVNDVATLKKYKCIMFQAGPQNSKRNEGKLRCDPSEMQMPYVPRRAPETQQKFG